MMRKINISALSLGLALSIGQLSFAQPGNPAIHALDIGDTLPDITLPVANYKSPFIHLQDLKGKLVILDFWNIRCGSCIAAMPEMQAMQRQFNDRIQVIMVTTDSISDVKKLAQRIKIIDTVSLPSIMQDSTLLHLFPMQTVPTHVWISPEGKVDYITNGYNTNERTISAYLEGKKPSMATKIEFTDIDFEQSLLTEGNGRHLNKMLYYSYFTKVIQSGISQSGVKTDTITKLPYGVKAINTGRLSLFQLALAHSAFKCFNNPNRIMLDVHDPENYHWPEPDEHLDAWKDKNLFCYEIHVEPLYSDRLFDLMKQDLEAFFNVEASIEIVKRTCWVLSKNGKPISYKAMNSAEDYFARKKLLRDIEKIADKSTSVSLPLIDETGIDKPISISLRSNIPNMEALRKELNAVGLDLKKSTRKIEIMVIRDKIKNPITK